MLYKKNAAGTLEKSLFESPTSEYRGAPFWAWNCKLEKETLLRQIDYFRQMGFGGFHMHSRTGLDTPYLSDTFMSMIKACCDKAEAEQMLAFLYDEDRWSSGPAGGKVTADTRFRRKRLELFPQDMGWNLPKDRALAEGVPYLLGCYDIALDSKGYLSHYRRIRPEKSASGTKWFAYCVNEKESPWFNGQTYLDTLDPEAVRTFLEITHERYKEAVGAKFGTVVPAIFTDEPNADHESSVTIPTPNYHDRIKRGWSRFFEEEYSKTYGEDLLNRLPELIWNCPDRSDSTIKYRYHDLKAKLFSENYCGQIGAWCRENGIALTGHLLREPTLAQQSIASGEAMRCYSAFDIPGIDMLCNHWEFTTAKQTQSIVHQYGKEGMLSELYGVTNWDFDFRGHKLQGDWQAALGVTVRVPHLTWVSMQGEAKRDYPASIGYQSPWFREYPYIENHFARLNTALTRGTPIVRIGVIHPIESYWICTGPNSQNNMQVQSLERNFLSVTEWLIRNHLDFDYISEATIPELASPDTPQKLGRIHYDAIVVPGCLSLRQTTLDYLGAFRENGGSVLFMGSCPDYVGGVKSAACLPLYQESRQIPFDSAALISALEDFRCISLQAVDGKEHADYLYQYRKDNDCRWLFLARSREPGASAYTYGQTQKDVVPGESLTIRIRGCFCPEEYDTLQGTVRPLAYTHTGGDTLIHVTLNGYDSLLLRLSDSAAKITPPEPAMPVISTERVRGRVPYTLSEPNVLLLDQAEWALDDMSWQPREEILRLDNLCRNRLGYPHRENRFAQPYTLPPQKAEHTLHLRFSIHSQIRIQDARLAIEDVDQIRLCFNGIPLEKTVTGYFTDEAIQTLSLPVISPGENILEVSIPYSPRANVEWCYVLGSFGVQLQGDTACLIPLPDRLGFGSITSQGFPFYGANITYHCDVELTAPGALDIHASLYRGSLIGVSLDGQRVGRIVLPPYTLRLKDVPAGKHTVSLTLFGNRYNSFGVLHMVNDKMLWINANAWRTTGDDWSYEYRLRDTGILKAPEFTIMKQSHQSEI